MDIRDFIVENILGQEWDSIEKSSRSRTRTLKGATIVASEKLSLPVKQCNFVITSTSLKDKSTPILLNSFSLPEAGITFDNDGESLFFPEPKVSLNTFSMTGYIPWNLSRSFYRLYMEQFKSGLLSMQNGRDFVLFMASRTNDYDTTIHSFTEAWAGVNAALGSIQGTADGASSIGQFLKDVKGNTETLVSQAIKEARSPEVVMNDSSYIKGMKPIAMFNNCRVSYPKIDQSQQSNDFATITINLQYSQYKDLIKID